MPDSSWKLIWIPISLWQLQRCQASPHHLTSTGIPMALPNLEENAEVSLTTGQESWSRLINASFEGPSPPKLQGLPQDPSISREIPRDLFLPVRWCPIPLHCMHSNSLFPIKHKRCLDFLDGSPESRQEHCNKYRGTLRSPQQHQRVPCTPNQLRMKPVSPTLIPEPSCDPNQTWKVAWLPLGNSRDAQTTPSQV